MAQGVLNLAQPIPYQGHHLGILQGTPVAPQPTLAQVATILLLILAKEQAQAPQLALA